MPVMTKEEVQSRWAKCEKEKRCFISLEPLGDHFVTIRHDQVDAGFFVPVLLMFKNAMVQSSFGGQKWIEGQSLAIAEVTNVNGYGFGNIVGDTI
jgi:hypothetical protein